MPCGGGGAASIAQSFVRDGAVVPLRIARRARNRPLTLESLYEGYGASPDALHVNERSHRAAFVRGATALTDEETGAVLPRVELIRPNERLKMLTTEFDESAWASAEARTFERLWDSECAATPEFAEDDADLVDRMAGLADVAVDRVLRFALKRLHEFLAKQPKRADRNDRE